jgi:hypothetical protein
MPKPDRALNWLHNNPRLPGYLQALARGEVPLTHDGLHQLDSWRTAAHLRDLLMACGTLPAVDRQIMLFERWSQPRLAAHGEGHDSRLLRQFLTWHQLPQLHAAARRAPLSPGARNYAAEAFLQAEQLLAWLHQHDLSLPTLSQRDLDRWNVQRHDRAAQVFLRWAQHSGHSPRLQQPSSPPHSATATARPRSTGSLQAGPGAATARSPAENTTQADTARHQYTGFRNASCSGCEFAPLGAGSRDDGDVAQIASPALVFCCPSVTAGVRGPAAKLRARPVRRRRRRWRRTGG